MGLKYRRNPFDDERVCEALATLARQPERSLPELGALEVSAFALLFIFEPPDTFYNEDNLIVASVGEILADIERGHAYATALAPWVEDVKKRVTEEQKQFLQEIGLDGIQGEDEGSARSVDDEEPEAPLEPEIEPIPCAKVLPEPAHAVSILEALVRRLDPRSAEHTCLELAAQTLRFLLDTGQADAFCAYLDKLKKPHAPQVS
jgi:hypothetical protein